jgi:hypothetical protein
VELSTEGLVAGLSALAAQDGGFPGDAHTPPDPAAAAAPAEDATPMRKRLLQRHRVSSGGSIRSAAADAAAGDAAAGAVDSTAAAMQVADPAEGHPVAAGGDDGELAFAVELLALPEMTEVELHTMLLALCTSAAAVQIDIHTGSQCTPALCHRSLAASNSASICNCQFWKFVATLKLKDLIHP